VSRPLEEDTVTDTTNTPGGFGGWPADALAFLDELARDNTRAFWTANVVRYRSAVLEPTRAVAAVLADEHGPPRVFRPHVDRRFRPSADPYRTSTGATVTGRGGTPYAFVLSVTGLRVQVGWQMFDAGQLRRYRDAVDDGAAGQELVAALGAVRGSGLTPDDVVALVGRPRGVPPDHPRLALLRLRGLHVDRAWPAGGWLATGEAVDRIRAAWRAARPVADWLDEHVGPRTQAAADRTAPVAPGLPDTADHGPAHSARPEEIDSV
jgi:uncharacterized protein (DUF2461 family)